jgi:Flp pilus assembly protein TadG
MLLVYDRVRAGGWRIGRDLWAADRASQLVEFAVALPLLVVFVVGIFDFSGAFTVKQKLTNAARDAARAAAADPISDLGATLPVSVTDAFYTIDNFLIANQINDCGIGLGNVTTPPPTATWKFSISGSALNGCPPAGLTIIINRGYYYPSVGTVTPPTAQCTPQSASGQLAVISTCVSIQYGYQWKFGQAASLLGSTPILPTALTATAVAMNEN